MLGRGGDSNSPPAPPAVVHSGGGEDGLGGPDQDSLQVTTQPNVKKQNT